MKEKVIDTEPIKDDREEVAEAAQEMVEEQTGDKVTDQAAEEDDKSARMAAAESEWQDKYLRLVAEFDNYRKRTLREKMDLIASGGEDVIKSLLTVMDDIDRALDAMSKSSDIDSIRQGIVLIHQKLLETLHAKGVEEITAIGQHPRKYSDTYIMLEQLGHRLDREVERLYQKCEAEGLRGMDITHAIEDQIDLSNVLKRCTPGWDGGFVICGITGSGESFSVRDPWGIRPAFYYADDEIIVLASERPVIQTVMNVQVENIRELNRGEAILVNKKGEWHISQIVEPKENKACSFERIYFSRGSDVDIYRERKRLGDNLVHPILKAVDYDLNHTVFSFIPNTAEVAYFGMQEGLNNYLNKLKKEWIADRSHLLREEELEQILSMRIRSEKVAIKDIKLRTFIAEGNSRNDLAAHVYDITYGSIEPFIDNLVVIDDSIVRGTTLRQSIIGILDRLHPKKIVIVSSSPQVRYPDYYGIDMSRMNEFIAFKAAVALLRDRRMEYVILDAYQKAKRQQTAADGPLVNYVKEIYAPFTDEEISVKMVELLTPAGTQAKVEIVYQTLEGLHASCPEHPGDWYFSGDYPTPGGTRLVNEAFIHYMEEEYLVK